MIKYPTTRFVFDRKKTATNEKKALIQIEILWERKKKYISTGVRVCKNQYNPKILVCNTFDMVVLNKRLKAIKGKIDDFITSLMEKNEPFTFDKLESYLDFSEKRELRFTDYLTNRIEERGDIRETTRKTHRKLIGSLEDFGKIVYFSDLIKRNIVEYDDYLHRKGLKQTSIYSYHKLLKTYIHDAMSHELITSDPYIGLTFKRGESENGRYLTEEEFNNIKEAKMPTKSLEKVRDLFVIQCLTGLAYSDLMDFDFSKITREDGNYFLSDKRNKTGVEYCAVFLPDAMNIVKKYNGKLPKFSNQQYNMRLKLVAEYAGVYKDMASHWGRRTCGMLLLNKGVSMETVSKVLGHSSIRTTESVYAKMLPKTIAEEVSKKLGR